MSDRTALRWIGGLATAIALAGCSVLSTEREPSAVTERVVTEVAEGPITSAPGTILPASEEPPEGSAEAVLATLPVKGRAPKTGYARGLFGSAWSDSNGALWGGNALETRQDILSRDLTEVSCKTPPPLSAAPHCVVRTGVLNDPYTGKTIWFVRGNKTSTLVQIDHVVALSDAWQKGAQQLTTSERVDFANDPLNLIATNGAINQAKGDSDAATWLVPNKRFRCPYVARQIAVKSKYRLWVTEAEKEAMGRVLAQCPGELLPTTAEASQRTVSP